MQEKPSLSIVLDRRSTKKSGGHPVKLMATFQTLQAGRSRWVQKYYSLGAALSESEFSSVMGKPRSEELKALRRSFDKAMAKARGILESNEFVTVEVFDRLYLGKSGVTVGAMMDRYAEELREFGQVSTASSYKTASRSLQEFAGRDFSFQEVSQDFLRRYQKHMMLPKEGKTAGASQTTISIYLRCLRTVFNRAVEAKIVSADLYPFGRRRFQIQAVENHKQALSERQKNLVLAYDGPYRKAVDFWIFSYFCNGMNLADICRLKIGQIRDGMIYLDRSKTFKTSRIRKKIEIPLRAEASQVIARWGNKSLNPNDYVFPVLRDGLTAQQIRYKVQHFTAEVNDGLRKVAEDLGFTFKFTTYTARHTFANISLLKGVSKEFIQEALGHASIRTTEIYTRGFDKETKRRMSAKL